MLVYFYWNFFYSLMFFFLTAPQLIIFYAWTLLSKNSFSKQGHLITYLDTNEFENCFKDSGYYDFFLLSLFDYMFRVFWIFSIIKMSEFSITEKASWLISGAILSAWRTYFYFEFSSITEFFFFCAVILVLVYFLAFFAMFLLFFI
jgi:hypothetical protein